MSTHPPEPTAEELAKAQGLLRDAPFAFVAMVDAGDATGPYVVPVNFAYEAGPGPFGRIVFHTGPGRKAAALAADPRVCVAATAGERYVQGGTPCSDGYAFRSVLAEGRAKLLEDAGELEAALGLIVAKYDPAAAGTPFDEKVLARTLVYQIAIERLGYRELSD